MLPVRYVSRRLLTQSQPRYCRFSGFATRNVTRHQTVSKNTSYARLQHGGARRDQLRGFSYSRPKLQSGGPPSGKHLAFVAFGSNVGDRVTNVESALDAMRARGLKVMRTSNLYETKAMYYEEQSDFLNGVCMACLQHFVDRVPLLTQY